MLGLELVLESKRQESKLEWIRNSGVDPNPANFIEIIYHDIAIGCAVLLCMYSYVA